MKRLIYPALLGLALAGCDQAKPKIAKEPTSQSVVTEATSPTLSPMPAAPADTVFENAAGMAAPQIQPPHSVIYQGELNLAVTDFNQATTSINRLLEQHDAYLSTSHETRADGQHRQEMTIKVSPPRFVALVTALGQLGHVESKDVASADVTADVLQTAQHLASKQTLAANYQQQLAHTTDKEAAGRLQEQARQLQLDLAADQAHLQQFGARSAWATLRLRYYQPLSATDTDEPQPAFAPQFQAAFGRGWSVVVSIAVVLANFWPLWLLAGAGAWGWRRWQLRQPEQGEQQAGGVSTQ